MDSDHVDSRAKLWRERIPLDWLAKLLAVVGSMFYGVLFIAYRAYYSAVGIRPEEAGVDNSFLVPRAVGLALVCLSVGLCLCVLLFYADPANVERQVRWQVVWSAAGLVPGLLVFGLLHFLTPAVPVWIAIGVGVVAVVMLLSFFERIHEHRSANTGTMSDRMVAVSVGVAFVAAMLVPAVAIIYQARDNGLAAAHGQVVTPIEVFYVPVLDARADDAVIRWPGNEKGWPPEVFGYGPAPDPARVLVLARNGSTLVVRVERGAESRIVHLNSDQVEISYPG